MGPAEARSGEKSDPDYWIASMAAAENKKHWDLTDRERRILALLVQDYIRTAEPVSSSSLAAMNNVPWSASTIRGVMSGLEERGFLEQPHVSAGRVPTSLSFQFYVNLLVDSAEIPPAERLRIATAMSNYSAESDSVWQQASRALSSLSRQAAVVIAPPAVEDVYKQLDLIRLSSDMVLAVLVTGAGQVVNKFIHPDQDHSQEELDNFVRYLNDLLGDLSVSQVQARIREELAKERIRFNRLFSRALHLYSLAFPESPERPVFIEGRYNLLENPEFADRESLKAVLRAFDEKQIILRLFDQCLQAEGVQIYVELDERLVETKGLAAVMAAFGLEGRAGAGGLGVIGPTRMNYTHVVPLVDFTAKLVGLSLECDLT
jgi:heat-inducible transcriptional repressor